jgi:hypothetical protein
MAIENFDEVKNYFEANKDSEDVKSFLGGFTNVDVFKEKVNTDPNFKSFMDSEKDKHSSKSLDTWKTNNLQKLIDDEVKKRFPEADPKDTEIANLKAQFEQMQKDALHKELTNQAYKAATERKLPPDLIDFVVGHDADSTNANLEKITKIFAEHDEVIRKEFVKNNSYTPPTDPKIDLGGNDKLREQVQRAMGTLKK